jgi:flagellar hook-basal body complex protein FliE
MININSSYNAIPTGGGISSKNIETNTKTSGNFADTAKGIGKLVAKVDDMQETSDVSIKDLLSGKNNDITSVVSSVAKADMSFKLLVGVRNKLIEAYKQTMNMQI